MPEQDMEDKDKISLLTPFGAVNIPFPKLPSLNSPNIDERRSKALGHALGEDLTLIIALIPLVGDIVGDAIADMHYAEEVKNLTPDEHTSFLEHNKVAPSFLAMMRTFMEK